MLTSSRSLIISTALALGMSLPACAYAGSSVTFSEIDVAESSMGFAQTEPSTEEKTDDSAKIEAKTEEPSKEEVAKAEEDAKAKDDIETLTTASSTDDSSTAKTEASTSAKADDGAGDKATASDSKDNESSDKMAEETPSVTPNATNPAPNTNPLVNNPYTFSGEDASQVLGGLFGLFGTLGQPSATATNERTISVEGTAEVNVVPDKASFGVSVVSEAKTAKEAQTANAESVNKINAALKDLKVDEKSVQTTSTSLYPQWNYEKNEEGTITGYVMTTRLEITGLNVDEVGGVIASLVDQGANSIDGPEYYASNYDEAYAEALAKAVKVATPKAEAIANAAGLTLGPIKTISEGWEDRTYALTRGEAKAVNSVDADTLSFDLNPGEVKVSASVQIVYAIG